MQINTNNFECINVSQYAVLVTVWGNKLLQIAANNTDWRSIVGRLFSRINQNLKCTNELWSHFPI